MEPGRLTLSLHCPRETAARPSEQASLERLQRTETCALRSRLKAGTLRPTGYDWPLWHEPRRRNAYTGPAGPIRDWRYDETLAYEHCDADYRAGRTREASRCHGWCCRPYSKGEPRWLLSTTDRPAPGFHTWLRRMTTTPKPGTPGPGDTPGRRDRSAATEQNALRVPDGPAPQPPRRHAMSIPTTTVLKPSGLVQAESPADELARLRAENERLRQARFSALKLKVSEKGALSIYGLGRFPVTLYETQWSRLLAMSADILAFIAAHRDELATKA